MNVTFRPIEEWPRQRGLRSPVEREGSRFEARWQQTLDLLTYELGRLGADAVVVKLALTERDIRRDGWPRSGARPEHPGVVVEWQIADRWSYMAADKYDDWHDNTRAIALSLEALRSVERWGAVEGEQYVGLRLELEAAMGPLQAQRIIRRAAGLEPETDVLDWGRVYRLALRRTHPDVGGSAEAFNEVQEAWRVLGGGA